MATSGSVSPDTDVEPSVGPGSTAAVFSLLRREGPLTPTDIQRRLARPERTVRYALRRLEQAGLVRSQLDPCDPRYRWYATTAPREVVS